MKLEMVVGLVYPTKETFSISEVIEHLKKAQNIGAEIVKFSISPNDNNVFLNTYHIEKNKDYQELLDELEILKTNVQEKINHVNNIIKYQK